MWKKENRGGVNFSVYYKEDVVMGYIAKSEEEAGYAWLGWYFKGEADKATEVEGYFETENEAKEAVLKALR